MTVFYFFWQFPVGFDPIWLDRRQVVGLRGRPQARQRQHRHVQRDAHGGQGGGACVLVLDVLKGALPVMAALSLDVADWVVAAAGVGRRGGAHLVVFPQVSRGQRHRDDAGRRVGSRPPARRGARPHMALGPLRHPIHLCGVARRGPRSSRIHLALRAWGRVRDQRSDHRPYRLLASPLQHPKTAGGH